MEPVVGKRLSITSLPLHAIPEHEHYQRRASQDDHAPTPDNLSPENSPRSSPYDKGRVELGSSIEDDGMMMKKKGKKKLFHNFFRRSAETMAIPDEKEEDREREKGGLTFTYSSPLPAPAPAMSTSVDGNMLSSSPLSQPMKRPPLAASAPAGAFSLSPVTSPTNSPSPSHTHVHQSNSMGRKGGLDKLKALMKDKDSKSESPEYSNTVYALVSPRDSNRKGEKEKDHKEKDAEPKEKHKDKEKKKKDKDKDKEKDKDREKEGEGTPEKKKGGFLTFRYFFVLFSLPPYPLSPFFKIFY